MAINTRNGWTAATLAHNADLHDASLATLQPAAPMPTPAASDVGPINGLAQSPLTAAALLTDPNGVHDQTLASRAFKNPGTGFRDVAAQGSVYQQNNVPAFLQQSIANLNAEQAMKRAQQSELVNRILQGVNSNSPNNYLFAEALRAAAVGAGAHVNFNAAVLDPALGRGYETATNAYANKTNQQTQSLKAANTAVSAIPALSQQRARLGAVVMGGYEGSQQQKLDRQIALASEAATPMSSTQLLGRSANSSGWFPTLPYY